MSEQQEPLTGSEPTPEEQVSAADSRVDAVAAVCLILLVVAAAVFWVSNQ